MWIDRKSARERERGREGQIERVRASIDRKTAREREIERQCLDLVELL